MSLPVASFIVGMPFQSGRSIRWESIVARARSVPFFQWLTASAGLLTVESTCLPTSSTATWPPPLNGT